MKLDQRTLVPMLLVALAVLLTGIFAGVSIMKGCSSPPIIVEPPVGIDAGPAERAVIEAGRAEVERLEAEHAADIARFEGEQAAKYEELRAQGPEALEGWFEDFGRTLFRDGGRR